MRIPFLAHIPSLTITARGVASPKLHGHAITRIVINVRIESLKEYPNNIYVTNDNNAIIIIIGTKYPRYFICKFSYMWLCISELQLQV